MLELVKPKVRCLEHREDYGKFVVEPLERGFGVTIGNSLRRVLLSSIEGAAVTSVKIDGIPHEFTTIKGVAEDCTEIILNLKELAIAMMPGALDQPAIGRIAVKGEGEVTGADVQLPPGLEVVSPETHIATLTAKNASLNMELRIEKGKGYVPADKRDRANLPIGQIPVDAIFTPIRRVNYFVEPTRVGHKSDYDRLTMEIWTNGAISPSRAVCEAARILNRHLDLFLDFIEKEEEERLSAEALARRRNKLLECRMDDLDFSVRTYNCLRKAHIETLGQLVQYTEQELLGIRNFGRKSLNEVMEKLASYGLKLREAKEEAPPPEEEEGEDDFTLENEENEVDDFLDA